MFTSILKKYFIFILLFINISSSIGKQYYNDINEYTKIINTICKYKKNINEKLIINNFNLNKLRKLLFIINIFIKKYSKTCINIDKLIYLKGLIYIKLYHGKLFDLNKYNYQSIIYAFKIFNNLKKNSLQFKNNKLLDYYLMYTQKIILKKKISIIRYYLHHHNYIAVINRSNQIINYINNKKILKTIKSIIEYSYLHLNIKTY